MASDQEGSALTGRTLRRIHGWHLVFWLGPGTALNWFLRHELWWTNAMSLIALQLSVATLWAAARTEAKQDKTIGAEES